MLHFFYDSVAIVDYPLIRIPEKTSREHKRSQGKQTNLDHPMNVWGAVNTQLEIRLFDV